MLRKIFICMLALICVGQAKANADNFMEFTNNDPKGRTISLYIYTSPDRKGGEWIYNIRPSTKEVIHHWGPNGAGTGEEIFIEVYNEIRTSNFNGRWPMNDPIDIKKSTFRIPTNFGGYMGHYGKGFRCQDPCLDGEGIQAKFVWNGTELRMTYCHNGKDPGDKTCW